MRRWALRLTFALTLFALPLAVTGCEEEEPETIVEEPPPPTPQEIAAQIMAEAQLLAPIPPKGATLPPGAGQAFLNQMRGIYTLHQATPEGQEALKEVGRKIDERLQAVEANELWDFVLVLCDVHMVFNPGSTRFDRSRQNAQVQLRKPKITLKGIYGDGGRVTAMMDFYMPLTLETFKEEMRPGEEKHGMKFIKVIGNNSGVEMEYLETRERSKVMVRNPAR